jgi:hypothetical protein
LTRFPAKQRMKLGLAVIEQPTFAKTSSLRGYRFAISRRFWTTSGVIGETRRRSG